MRDETYVRSREFTQFTSLANRFYDESSSIGTVLRTKIPHFNIPPYI